MKLHVALVLLVVLGCCHCTPYRPRYAGDKGDMPPPDEEGYEVNDNTHSVGGGFNAGGRLGLDLGISKNGLRAGIDKGLDFDWNAHAGSRTSRLRSTPYRPRYDSDEGDMPPPGQENYEVNANTHSVGGGFNTGGRLGLDLGISKNGLRAGIDKGLDFDWNAHAGSKTSRLIKKRPLQHRGYNTYRERQYQEDSDY